MNTVKINNEINLTYPDGFREMSETELTLYFSSPLNRWGVYDPEKHVILSVGWSKAKLFADADSVLFKIESRMRRNLLNYQRILYYKQKITTKKPNAIAIRFEYRVNEKKLVQVGDLIVFKYKGKFYTIHYITRKSNAAAERIPFAETLNSITFS